MEKYIIAIGGGEIANNETLHIDNTIVSLSSKRRKNLLFIPTASHDSVSYAEAVSKYFSKIGCTVDSLFMTNHEHNEEEIKHMIFESDIIYVGGGDTAYMMKTWEKYGVDKMLLQAYHKGIILSGLSAGAICWANAGHSDSQSFHSDQWEYVKVKGIGLIPAILCPHYNEKGREQFDTMIQHEHTCGIALENRTALVKKGNVYKILTEDPLCKAYWICCLPDGNITKKEIDSQWFEIAGGELIYR